MRSRSNNEVLMIDAQAAREGLVAAQLVELATIARLLLGPLFANGGVEALELLIESERITFISGEASGIEHFGGSLVVVGG